MKLIKMGVAKHPSGFLDVGVYKDKILFIFSLRGITSFPTINLNFCSLEKVLFTVKSYGIQSSIMCLVAADEDIVF